MDVKNCMIRTTIEIQHTYSDNIANLQLLPWNAFPPLILQYFYRTIIYCFIILKTLLLYRVDRGEEKQKRIEEEEEEVLSRAMYFYSRK